MARLALKPDSSFFRKIAIGAIGARAVCGDLARHHHEMYELERGSTDTKLWEEVKRKRVRIPDLVCVRCGLRIESRAKTAPDLSMSHSQTDEARSWDFGMVDTDLIAFPVCEAVDERYWSSGRLGDESSYWHERNWVRWQIKGWINYFLVRAFRSTPHARTTTKGVTEGSETSISWPAIFSARTGIVEARTGQKITLRRASDGHRHTRTLPDAFQIFVGEGESVETNQVIASVVQPLTRDELICTRQMPQGHIQNLLNSRERTQRFTAVKLARLRQEAAYRDSIAELARDEEEDVYIRLEAVSYLAAVCGHPVAALFTPYLNSPDQQNQLEAVIALGETATEDAVQLLSSILDNNSQPYFLRSTAAWSLSRVGREEAVRRLVAAFADVDSNIRDEALEGIVSIGGPATPLLFAGLRELNDIGAGCAEALRQQKRIPNDIVERLIRELRTSNPSPWTVWLVGSLPREYAAGAIAELQETSPELHYAITLLWRFIESWISRRWESKPGTDFPS